MKKHKPVPNLMDALKKSLANAVQPPATPQPDMTLVGAGIGQRQPATPQEPAPSIDCPLCGEEVRQVSSATLSLALWQHVRWVCRRASTPSPEGQTWQDIEECCDLALRRNLSTEQLVNLIRLFRPR